MIDDTFNKPGDTQGDKDKPGSNIGSELGVNPKDTQGTKKVPLSNVPSSSIIYEALAFRDGAKKYGPYNWRTNKVQAMLYIDALYRHVMSWVDGEDLATDSGVHHLGHAKACLGVLIDAIETKCLVDNRPAKGTAAELLKSNERKV